MNTLFIIGIFFSFFLQFLLFAKKDKAVSDKILGIWMFVIGIHLFSYYIYNLGFWEKYPHLVGITHPVPLLYGPLLYLYVVFSLRSDQRFRWKDYLHFVPFVASYLYMVPYFFFYSAEEKVLMNHGKLDDYYGFMMLSLVAFIVSGITYTILAYRLIGRFERVIHKNFSFDEKISLNWLRYCIWGLAFVFVTVLFFSLLQNTFGIQLTFNPDYIYYSEIILFVLFLGFMGIRHEGIFSETKEGSIEIINLESGSKQAGEYKKSGLKTEEAELYHQRLMQLMTEKKLYLEPKLTLNALADELGISVNHLSQLINQYQGKNFYDFVNEYRIEEFKARVSSPRNKHLSILAIALDSGFNSKSSFNSVFKKHTGITPSQFMAENQ
jgi:AraC-like DNA-binding protein